MSRHFLIFGLYLSIFGAIFAICSCTHSDDNPTGVEKTVFTIMYDGNGNTDGTVPSPQTKIAWTDLTLANNTGNLVKTGHKFVGWNTAVNGNGTDYAVGAVYTVNANMTLYAKWVHREIVAGPEVTDIDGNVYTSIVLGTQTWTVENLRTTKYSDGTNIPHVIDSTSWASLATPGYCFYNNSISSPEQQKWGALYNWYAVNTGKLAPTGWHVPTDEEWNTLENYLVANGYNWDGTTSSNKIGKSLAANTDWSSSDKPGTVGNTQTENNSTGFSALPGGGRRSEGGFNDNQSLSGAWWAATENNLSSAIGRSLMYSYSNSQKLDSDKRFGLSIRLVKD